jgi:hypothetical protein
MYAHTHTHTHTHTNVHTHTQSAKRVADLEEQAVKLGIANTTTSLSALMDSNRPTTVRPMDLDEPLSEDEALAFQMGFNSIEYETGTVCMCAYSLCIYVCVVHVFGMYMCEASDGIQKL